LSWYIEPSVPEIGTPRPNASPQKWLVLTRNSLAGFARKLTDGGDFGSGTIFSISLGPSINLPQLAIVHFGGDVILTWPTNDNSFTLQSTSNLLSSTAWATASPTPVVVNGLNTVTNTISGTQRYYRLSQ